MQRRQLQGVDYTVSEGPTVPRVQSALVSCRSKPTLSEGLRPFQPTIADEAETMTHAPAVVDPTLSRALHMARHRLPYAAERAFEWAAAKMLVTGRQRRATCPMQCRAKLIGGREIRPRNLWITGSAVRESAGHSVAPMQRGARRHT